MVMPVVATNPNIALYLKSSGDITCTTCAVSALTVEAGEEAGDEVMLTELDLSSGTGTMRLDISSGGSITVTAASDLRIGTIETTAAPDPDPLITTPRSISIMNMGANALLAVPGGTISAPNVGAGGYSLTLGSATTTAIGSISSNGVATPLAIAGAATITLTIDSSVNGEIALQTNLVSNISEIITGYVGLGSAVVHNFYLRFNSSDTLVIPSINIQNSSLFVVAPSSAVEINSITANTLFISARNSITAQSVGSGVLTANNLTLISLEGSLGSANSRINLANPLSDTVTAKLTAGAPSGTGIYLTSDGDIISHLFSSAGNSFTRFSFNGSYDNQDSNVSHVVDIVQMLGNLEISQSINQAVVNNYASFSSGVSLRKVSLFLSAATGNIVINNPISVLYLSLQASGLITNGPSAVTGNVGPLLTARSFRFMAGGDLGATDSRISLSSALFDGQDELTRCQADCANSLTHHATLDNMVVVDGPMPSGGTTPNAYFSRALNVIQNQWNNDTSLITCTNIMCMLYASAALTYQQIIIINSCPTLMSTDRCLEFQRASWRWEEHSTKTRLM